MQTYSVINKVEKQFPVETIVAENIPIWQFLRNIYADKQNENHFSERNRIPKSFPRITNKLSNIFWEKQNKKQHYPAVLFTDVLEERSINGLISD